MVVRRSRLNFIACWIALGSLVFSGSACVTVNEATAVSPFGPKFRRADPSSRSRADDRRSRSHHDGLRNDQRQDARRLGPGPAGEIPLRVRVTDGRLAQGRRSRATSMPPSGISEVEATQVQVGRELSFSRCRRARPTQTRRSRWSIADTISKSQAAPERERCRARTAPPEKTPVALEPTVVLDEHSNYLNHLNQLRRINAGDDLADRPGYGLYLVRIPVTLSPGPRSRRGKGAIITVSAKSVMTKHTLRNCAPECRDQRDGQQPDPGDLSASRPGRRPEPGTGAADRSRSCRTPTPSSSWRGRTSSCSGRGRAPARQELGDEPHHRSARVAEWLRGELESSYHLLEQAATPTAVGRARRSQPIRSKSSATRSLERDFARIAQMQPTTDARPARPEQVCGQQPRSATDEPMERRKRVVNMLAFALRIQAAGVNRRLKQDMLDQDPTLKPRSPEAAQLLRAELSDEAFQALRALREYQVAVARLCDRAGDRPAECRRRLRPRKQSALRPGRIGSLGRRGRSPASPPSAGRPMMRRPSA